ARSRQRVRRREPRHDVFLSWRFHTGARFVFARTTSRAGTLRGHRNARDAVLLPRRLSRIGAAASGRARPRARQQRCRDSSDVGRARGFAQTKRPNRTGGRRVSTCNRNHRARFPHGQRDHGRQSIARLLLHRAALARAATDAARRRSIAGARSKGSVERYDRVVRAVASRADRADAQRRRARSRSAREGNRTLQVLSAVSGSRAAGAKRDCGQVSPSIRGRGLERGTGIEPVAQAWEAWVLPLYEPRVTLNDTRDPYGFNLLLGSRYLGA